MMWLLPLSLSDHKITLPPGQYALPWYYDQHDVERLIRLLRELVPSIRYHVELRWDARVPSLLSRMDAADATLVTIRGRVPETKRAELVGRVVFYQPQEPGDEGIGWCERVLKARLVSIVRRVLADSDHPLAAMGVEHLPLDETAASTGDPLELLALLEDTLAHRLQYARFGLSADEYRRSLHVVAGDRLADKLLSLPDDEQSPALEVLLAGAVDREGEGEVDARVLQGARALQSVGLARVVGSGVLLMPLARAAKKPVIWGALAVRVPGERWTERARELIGELERTDSSRGFGRAQSELLEEVGPLLARIVHRVRGVGWERCLEDLAEFHRRHTPSSTVIAQGIKALELSVQLKRELLFDRVVATAERARAFLLVVEASVNPYEGVLLKLLVAVFDVFRLLCEAGESPDDLLGLLGDVEFQLREFKRLGSTETPDSVLSTLRLDIISELEWRGAGERTDLLLQSAVSESAEGSIDAWRISLLRGTRELRSAPERAREQLRALEHAVEEGEPYEGFRVAVLCVLVLAEIMGGNSARARDTFERLREESKQSPNSWGGVMLLMASIAIGDDHVESTVGALGDIEDQKARVYLDVAATGMLSGRNEAGVERLHGMGYRPLGVHGVMALLAARFQLGRIDEARELLEAHPTIASAIESGDQKADSENSPPAGL